MTLRLFAFLVSIVLMSSCEKEHLQPDIPGQPDPFVYFIGRIENDSVRIGGGVDSYIGSTSVRDTLSRRMFNFALQNIHNPALLSIHFSINNYQIHLGEVQGDLDHTIFPGVRHFQDSNNFIPLAVTIHWIDHNGIKYSSAPLVQSQPLSINSVEDVSYENKSYKKATVTFECNLSDDLGRVIHLTNGRAVILFGID